MIRALLLCLSCFGTVGFSRGNDDLSEAPACENMAPDDIYLDLSNMDLQAIRKPIASSPTITCLNLARNNITTITPDAFNGLSELYYLNLAGNLISYNNLAETKLSKLKTLVLDGMIPNVNDDYYLRGYYGNQEKKLSLFFPELEKLSLQNFPSDKQDLVRYSLQILEIPNLTHLYLSNNKLISGELSNIIYRMNNLTHLYLDGNEMSNFHGNSMENLRYLSMNRNRVQALGSNDYYDYRYSMGYGMPWGMYNLEYLSLMFNEISIIGLESFESSQNLRFLNLAQNKIENFPSNASSYLVNLRNLTLDNNLLTSVPHICAMKELRSLSLSFNNIRSINDTSFCNLRQLSAIYLKNIDLSNIADETFGHLPALLMLDLSGNKIATLPEYWIAPHNFIVELHLDANEFIDIESMSLKRVNGLQSLSIGHNPMETITVLSLMDLPNSTRIDVSRDPLI